MATRVRDSKNGSSRTDILESNVVSLQKELGQPRYPGLRERLDELAGTNPASIEEAIAFVDHGIKKIEDEISSNDQERVDAWQQARTRAEAAYKVMWEDKIFKFYTNEVAYVNELLAEWDKATPRPRPTWL